MVKQGMDAVMGLRNWEAVRVIWKMDGATFKAILEHKSVAKAQAKILCGKSWIC